MNKFLVSFLLTSIGILSLPVMASESLSCDLSVTEVREVMDFEDEYGEYENTWDSAQWFSIFASNKGVVYPKDRLEREQFKDIIKEGYSRYYNEKMVQTSIPQLSLNDRALALRQGSIRDLEDGEYAIIKSSQLNNSIFIDVLIYQKDKVVMSGRAILSADKPRVFLIGEATELSELKEKNPDLEEMDLFQKLKQGSLVSYMMKCSRY